MSAIASPASSVARAVPGASRVYLGIHDGHNASVAVVRGGRIQFAMQEERLSRVKNQGDAPSLALRAALELVEGDAVPGMRVALNGRYVNYSQWSREAVAADYRHSGSLWASLKQPLKGTLIDRWYQRRKAAARVSAIT